MKNIFSDLQIVATVLLCSALNAISASALAEPESMLVVENAWSPQMPPSLSVMAGYLSASNVSAKPITVTGFSSPAYQYVEMHRSLIDDGVANMTEVKSLFINPGERIEFSPGGFHLMLINPTPAYTYAKPVPIVLYLDNGSRINFILDVVPRPAQSLEIGEAADHSEHMHHGF
jgi:copper(I)-binding protein